ncbi:Hypothetical predicted protein [Octopus vulgaris]|uniref:Reverse transcriptase RNase H-like domain-containing protein n=1 Tax=Octopus vulgaris TaxID=6645 RepID=A0AA36BLV8_OCTVU|nr:Hypothetical predicted protein [Octopus vulgaris]
MKFPILASACGLIAVSDRASARHTCLIISDLTASTSGECFFIIDRSKVSLELPSKRKSQQQEDQNLFAGISISLVLQLRNVFHLAHLKLMKTKKPNSENSSSCSGLANFYRRLIPHCAETLYSLNKLLQHLIQQFHHDEWQPPTFFCSERLNSAETKYNAFSRKLLAFHLSVIHFQRIFEWRNFATITDHKPLLFALHCKPDKLSPTDKRYILGSENIVADSLSRLPVNALFSTAEINVDEMWNQPSVDINDMQQP